MSLKDWKRTESMIVAKSKAEKYLYDGELINEEWVGDRESIKTYKIPDNDYRKNGLLVKVLYKNGEKQKESYYSHYDNLRSHEKIHYKRDTYPKLIEVFEYKNTKLETYREGDINIGRILYTTYFFQYDKLIKTEEELEHYIITIHTINGNIIEEIEIERDYETNYITSEIKIIKKFNDLGRRKSIDMFKDNKLIIQVLYDDRGIEIQKIIHDETCKDYDI